MSNNSGKKCSMCDFARKAPALPKKAPKPPTADTTSIVPEKFDFDVDSVANNFQLDFIHSTALLRSRNYQIRVDTDSRTSAKLTAGRVVPGLPTSASLVAGLTLLELLKLTQGTSTIKTARESQCNMAINYLVFTQPTKPRVRKSLKKDPLMFDQPLHVLPEGHTKWARIDIKRDVTLKELQAELQTRCAGEHKLSINLIVEFTGKATPGQGLTLYNSFLCKTDKSACKMTELYNAVERKQLPEKATFLPLVVLAENEHGHELRLPTVFVHFK
jgi:hypothetical protein